MKHATVKETLCMKHYTLNGINNLNVKRFIVSAFWQENSNAFQRVSSVLG